MVFTTIDPNKEEGGEKANKSINKSVNSSVLDVSIVKLISKIKKKF